MTTRSALALAFAALIGFSTACTDSGSPVESTPSVRPTPAPPFESTPPDPTPAPPFPALARPGDVYVGPDDLYDLFIYYHGSRIASRYVLYEDGTFGLQVTSLRIGFFEYLGRYARTDSRITFDFGGDSNIAGSWDAVGTLSGDSMSVEYSLMMQHSDFINGVYVRQAGAQ